jgi:hypothetical protein
MSAGFKRNVVTTEPTTLQEGHEVFYNNGGVYTHYIGNSSNEPELVSTRTPEIVSADISFFPQKRWIKTSDSSRILLSETDYNNAVSGASATSNYVPTGYVDDNLLYIATKVDAENVLSLWSVPKDLDGTAPTYIGNPLEGVSSTWEAQIKEALMKLDDDNSLVHYWYKGSDGAGNRAVGYATAPKANPLNTTKSASNPIIEASDINTALGVSDVSDVSLSSVIRNPNASAGDSDLYWFFGSYSRTPISRNYLQENYTYGIWFGTGPDLETITVQNSPITNLTSATNLSYMPCVYYNESDGCYVMIFSDVTELTSNRAIGGLRVAMSKTGIDNWQVTNHWLVKPKVYDDDISTIENRIYAANIITGNTTDTWDNPSIVETDEGGKVVLLVSTSEGADRSALYKLNPTVGRLPDNKVRVRAVRDAVLAVSNNSWTSVPFDEIDLEASTDFDIIWTNNETDAFIRRTGWYKISATVAFEANGTGYRGIRFLLNGSGTPIPLGTSNPTGTTTSVSTYGELYLESGDKLEVQIYQNSGGSLNTDNNWSNVQFTIYGELE